MVTTMVGAECSRKASSEFSSSVSQAVSYMLFKYVVISGAREVCGLGHRNGFPSPREFSLAFYYLFNWRTRLRTKSYWELITM